MPADIHTNFQVDGEETGETPRIDTTSDATANDDDAQSPPLWKQAAGAIVGAMIALAVYSIYEAAAPTVTAWISGEQHAQHKEKTDEPTGTAHVSTGARHKRGEVQE